MKAFHFSDNSDGSCEEGFGHTATFLFQPDTVLPIQYFERLRRNIYLQSEKRLMLAVLEDAVACFQKFQLAPDKKGQKLFHEVDEWFRSKDDSWLFSFENICEALAMNSDYLRRGLLEWKEKQPVSRRFGPRKGTKRFGKKARVFRGIEQHRVSAIANHEGDRFEIPDTDLEYLRSVDTGGNEQGRSVSVVGE